VVEFCLIAHHTCLGISPQPALVTAANVSEVTVGLKVVDQMVAPASLGTDKSYDSTEFRWQLGGDAFSPLSLLGDGLTDIASQDVLLKCRQPARVSGRWIRCLSDHCLFLGHSIKNFGIGIGFERVPS
jgi:hypothetical protein